MRVDLEDYGEPSNGHANGPPDCEPFEPNDDDAPDAPAKPTESAKPPKPTTPLDVLTRWREQGPLIHEPTGIAGIDELTGGGPVYGTRWYLAGAPDAGKTALLVQLADVYLQRGIAVGMLAVDEEDGDLVTRFVQRRGWSRQHAEIRDPGVLNGMATALEGLPLRFYDDQWTIETAAADLAEFAKVTTGGRAMLGIDSVQTVQCDAEGLARLAGKEMAEVQAVTARSRAIRATATEHRLITIATSELGRSAYRSGDPEQQTSTLSSAKWSGAIEYSARVLIGLRSVAGETDLIDLEFAKNKHGVQARQGDPVTGHVFLRIDRASQIMSQAGYDPPPPKDRAAQQTDRARDQATSDAEPVWKIIEAEPGIGTRDLYAAAKAATGIGRTRVDAAIRVLGDRIERRPGENRSLLHFPKETTE